MVSCFVSSNYCSCCWSMSVSGYEQDKTPPVISIADDGFIYNQSMSRTDLLAGVTAQDDRDGDVTDQIVVEQVTVSEDGATASITYAVTDNSKNVAKK